VPQRHFVGWNTPLLPIAAAWVLDLAQSQSRDADLSRCVLVVPGARAGRLLLGMLVDEAARRGASFIPPLLVTPGEVVEPLLGVPRARAATPLARELAWNSALAAASDDELGPLVRPNLVDPDAGRRTLAGFLERLHTELGGHGLRIADVAGPAEELAGPLEGARWRAASLIATRFCRTLESWGLSDDVSARLARVEQAARSPDPLTAPVHTHLVLVGVPELPGLVRRAIEIAAGRGVRIEPIVHAPESLGDRFDQFGCVTPHAWTTCALPIEEDQIVFATDQTDQASRALAWLAQVSPDAETGDVVIGIAEPSLAAMFSLEMRRVSSLRVRAASGTSADRAEPARLLSLVSNTLERRTFNDLMALIRHPRIAEWLRSRSVEQRNHVSPSAWLGHLDDYAAAHVPRRLAFLPTPVETDEAAALTFVTESCGALLADLWTHHAETDEAPVPASLAARATLALLHRLYGHLPASSVDPIEARIAHACVLLADDLREQMSLCESAPTVDASERPSVFLSRLIARQSSHAIPEPPDSNAIEMVGWLELAHDPSPIAAFVGMSDRNVPGAEDHHPMLPGSLRRRLGLPTAESRLARDSFLAATMARSRPRMLFMAPRRDDEGSPLIPSRLLLRCEREQLPNRMHRALGRSGDGPPRAVVAPRVSVAPRSQFPVAPLVDRPPITRMSVTSFKDYLASPYLFYLRHVLRLSEQGDAELELDPPSFGALIHGALERFGRSDVRNSPDAAVIRESVLDHFRTLARERYGPRPPVAVAIQNEHAEVRLSRWADTQAARSNDGWEILHSEWTPKASAEPGASPPMIQVPEGAVALRGKIDRIDRHRRTGQVAILDYKSSDTPADPNSTHRRRDGAWRDLQLPLYRELIRSLDLSGPITLGYFNIPRDLDRIAVTEATWTDDDLRSADDAARSVVSQVLRRKFEDLGRMDDEGTLGLIAGLNALSDYRPARAAEPTA
jgi:ATP-dependent helicase/nuclease subunit B